MNFGLIVVGDEILSGKRQDAHLGRVIELLGARGQSLSWARYVGDEPERLTQDLRDAFTRAREHGEMVFSCGGIGATPDDHTRQCAAQALGVPLQMHTQARDLILARMQVMAQEAGVAFEPNHPDHIHRLNMAVFPQGADLIPNAYNGIAGFSVRMPGQGGVFFVPGFPVMAGPMIEWVLDHHAQAQAVPLREYSVIVRRGVEGDLTPLMLDIQARFDEVRVFSLPSVDHPQWGRHVELGVKGCSASVALAYAYMLAALRQQGADLGPELVR